MAWNETAREQHKRPLERSETDGTDAEWALIELLLQRPSRPWLGPEEVAEGLEAVLPTLRDEDRAELSAARATMPNWIAQAVSTRLAHG